MSPFWGVAKNAIDCTGLRIGGARGHRMTSGNSPRHDDLAARLPRGRRPAGLAAAHPLLTAAAFAARARAAESKSNF